MSEMIQKYLNSATDEPTHPGWTWSRAVVGWQAGEMGVIHDVGSDG